MGSRVRPLRITGEQFATTVVVRPAAVITTTAHGSHGLRRVRSHPLFG